MFPTHRTALVAITRWPAMVMASAPPAHRALTTPCRSDWCTTSWLGSTPAIWVGRVIEHDRDPGPRDGGQPTGRLEAVGFGLRSGDRRVAAAGLTGRRGDLSLQRLQGRVLPVHVGLRRLHQPGKVAAVAGPDVAALGVVRAHGEAEAGQQADAR